MDKQLIATVGLPRSGKSTWSKAHALLQGWPIVNPDSIRLALYGQRYFSGGERHVWAIADTMVKALFNAGHQTVVLDATNTTRMQRDQWKREEWDTYFHLVPTEPDVCIQRALNDGMPDLVKVIEQMADGFQPLEEDENRIKV